MTTEQKPTAFISHASADKERFVRPFAAVLRETHGVDAWVDEWEIRPGDRFAEKIHAAIAKADAVVVVLSENSANSEWVKNEIDAAVVREVNKEVKLLPVVLDGLPDQRVPPALRPIHQVRADADNHEIAAEQINRAIRELSVVEKPPLASDAERGGIPAQLARPIPPAFKLGDLLQMAESGNAEAQWALGVVYRRGEGVPRDHAEAVKWYRLAAEQGHARAQNNLGVRYHEGEGVPKNDAEAVKWYRRAAEQGHATAQYNLGERYSEGGEGVAQDYAEAVKWYRRAAGNGYAKAEIALERLRKK